MMVDVVGRGEGVNGGGDDGVQRGMETEDTHVERDTLMSGVDGSSVERGDVDVDVDDGGLDEYMGVDEGEEGYLGVGGSVDGYMYEDDEGVNEYVDENVNVDDEGVNEYVDDEGVKVNKEVRQMEEEVVSLIVSRLDTDGCLLKLYCNLQGRPSLTLEQQLLSQFFSSSSRARTAYIAAFRRALEVMDTGDGKPLTCDRVFSKCHLQEDALERLLSYTWHHQNMQA